MERAPPGVVTAVSPAGLICPLQLPEVHFSGRRFLAPARSVVNACLPHFHRPRPVDMTNTSFVIKESPHGSPRMAAQPIDPISNR